MNLDSALSSACFATMVWLGSAGPTGSRVVPLSARSDTTRVRSVGSGRWGGAQIAQEELRIAGGADGIEFGSLDCLTALPDGGVAVLDSKGRDGPVIQVFDANGRRRRSLGRAGAGPGEIGSRAGAFCLTSAPSGTILMLDYANSRVNRWSPAGDVLPSIPLPPGVGGFPPYILPGPEGSIFVRVSLVRSRSGVGIGLGSFGFVRVAESGRILDTLPRAASPQQSKPSRIFDPVERSLPLPQGRYVTSGDERLAFVVQGPHAGVSVLLAERPVDRVRVLPEERREIEAELAFTAKQTKGMMPSPGVAELKAATSDMMVDVEGRIWFQMNVRAVKGAIVTPRPAPGQPTPPGQSYRMPPVFSVFTSAGVFLGEVRLPLVQAYLQNFGFVGSHLWGIRTDANDFPVLVKWRIPGARTP